MEINANKMKTQKQKVGAKPLPKGQKKLTISLRLHPDLLTDVDSLPESRTQVIEMALVYYFAGKRAKLY